MQCCMHQALCETLMYTLLIFLSRWFEDFSRFFRACLLFVNAPSSSCLLLCMTSNIHLIPNIRHHLRLALGYVKTSFLSHYRGAQYQFVPRAQLRPFAHSRASFLLWYFQNMVTIGDRAEHQLSRMKQLPGEATKEPHAHTPPISFIAVPGYGIFCVCVLPQTFT